MKIRHAAVRLFCLAAASLLLSSCQFMDALGFDTYDYMSEEIHTTHPTDCELAVQLEDLLDILITDSPTLSPFENMSEAIRLYRDAVLTEMLETGYSKYSGNAALIEKASRAYPEYSITQIIPESEFEATMYRCFGGDVMLTHKDGERFRYLSKVGAYISMATPVSSGLRASVTKLAETDKTYRVYFRVVGEDVQSDEYFALVIKREDGSLYIKKLLAESAA